MIVWLHDCFLLDNRLPVHIHNFSLYWLYKMCLHIHNFSLYMLNKMCLHIPVHSFFLYWFYRSTTSIYFQTQSVCTQFLSFHFTYRSTTQMLLKTLLVCTHPDSCLHSGLGFSHPGVSLDRGCLGHTQVFQVALETRPMVNTGHEITVNKYTAFFYNS